MTDILCIADAYLQGVVDATPVGYRHCTDTWYGFGDYDINVDGSDYHGEGEDTLFVYVYKRGDYSNAIYWNNLS
jgi:hypothetical protein